MKPFAAKEQNFVIRMASNLWKNMTNAKNLPHVILLHVQYLMKCKKQMNLMYF